MRRVGIVIAALALAVAAIAGWYALALLGGGKPETAEVRPADARPIANLAPGAVPLSPSTRAALLDVVTAQSGLLTGDCAAYERLNVAIERAQGVFEALDDRSWASPLVRQHLLKLVLSGGSIDLLEEAIARRVFPAAELPLARAILAYAAGDLAAARHLEKGGTTDAMPSLAGHLALVRAVIIAEADPVGALRALEDAALKSPGTLVEETGLRLIVENAIRVSDFTTFETAALRHMRRFPKSVYAAEIDGRIADVLAAAPLAERWLDTPRVKASLDGLPLERRQSLLSTLAEAALRTGRFDLARRSATTAMADMSETSVNAAIMRVVADAASIATPRGGAPSQADLPLAMPVDIRELADAAGALRAMVEAPPQQALEAEAAASSSSSPAASPGSRTADDGRATAEQAQSRLVAADRLLQEHEQ